MDKYDEIANRLSAAADRKRTMAQIKAQSEIDAINREYAAYVDGVDDAIRQIRAAEAMHGKGGDA
jgi:hypothetical protein